MGCGSSKGVAPEPASQLDASPLKTKLPAASGEATTDVAALHKQRLEQQQQQVHAQAQQLQQHELSLPGRIESTTAPAPPPLLKELSEAEDLPPPGKAPAAAAADAEFNYEKELQHSAVLGGGTLSSKQHLSPLAGPAQGAVVGGLLSKQPDWLRGSSTETNPAAAGAGPAPDGTLTSSSANTGPQVLPVAAQSGAAAAAGKASSLPPLMGRGAAQGPLPPLFPGGARSLAPLEPQPKQQAVVQLSDSGSAAGSVAGGADAAAESALASVDGRVSRSSAGGLDGPEATRQAVEQKEGTLQLQDNSSKSSAASSRSSSPAAGMAAGGRSLQDTADPWSALQNTYAGSSPSPDSSMAGGSVPAAAAAAHNVHAAAQASAAAGGPALHNPLGAAGAASVKAQQQGSRRATATVAASAQQELVLVDSDDEATAAHGVVHKGAEQPEAQQQLNGSIAGLKSGRSSFSAAGGKVSAQSSQHSISSVPFVAKSGGWGVGSLAGAGTIMLGNEAASSKGPGRKPGVAAPSSGHDDVFGDEGDEAPIIPKNAAAALVGEGSNSSSHGRARMGGAAGVQDALDVEEIEDDVDALIESEMARDGLPADLAAKLAQFEAMGANGDGDEAPAAGGSGSDSDGPSIFAMMNNRQGSWRAA